MSASCSLAGSVRGFFRYIGSMTSRPMLLLKDIRIPQCLIHDFRGGHPEIFLDLTEFVADLNVAGLRPLHRQLSVPKYQSELGIFHVCVTHASSIL